MVLRLDREFPDCRSKAVGDPQAFGLCLIPTTLDGLTESCRETGGILGVEIQVEASCQSEIAFL